MKRFAAIMGLGITLPLYQAFVLMNLWNWFVVQTFHLSEVSYLYMLGVYWFVRIIVDQPQDESLWLWTKAFELMGFCVPAENKEMADVVIKEIELGTWRNMWVMESTLARNLAIRGNAVLLASCHLPAEENQLR